jgi:N-acetyltransferase
VSNGETTPLPPVRPVTLEGRYVCLQPLSLKHLDDLCRAGLDASLWHWTPAPVRTDVEMYDYIVDALQDQTRGLALPWATVELASGRAVGSTRFGNIDRTHRRLEIGWTWLGRAWHRTPLNTEAKYLQLRHAFDVLQCVRVEFKTDALNTASRAALRRLGAREEGTLRRHMITADGRSRDTVYYSVLDEEWPDVRGRLRAWLD